jgi:hypothetical protein
VPSWLVLLVPQRLGLAPRAKLRRRFDRAATLGQRPRSCRFRCGLRLLGAPLIRPLDDSEFAADLLECGSADAWASMPGLVSNDRPILYLRWCVQGLQHDKARQTELGSSSNERHFEALFQQLRRDYDRCVIRLSLRLPTFAPWEDREICCAPFLRKFRDKKMHAAEKSFPDVQQGGNGRQPSKKNSDLPRQSPLTHHR